MRIVSAAGFDLRIMLEPHEDHDEVLESLERQRPREEQERWRKLQEGIAQSRPKASGRFVTGLRIRTTSTPAIIETLNRHGVRYVVIGALAD